MDIRRWLVETVEQSDEDSHHRRDSHQQHKRISHHHKRVDTPTLELPFEAPSRHERDEHKARRHKRKISEVRSATAATSSSSSSSSTSDSSSSSSAPSERFERRQRHKTRKDLYEPHSGVRKKRTKQDDKGEAKTKKRKKKKKKEKEHRRTEKKKRGVKLPGQDFHENFTAKNVRDDRLTLKPQPALGLLKKGRASSPTKPRGLPDLVFSEMQFLKKPRPSIEQSGHAEEVVRSEKKRSKKNNKVEEEEVSAYFGTTHMHGSKHRDETTVRTATPTTDSSKPRAVTVLQKDRIATVEDPRRTQSQSPRHTLRSRTSNISTLRATSSTAPLVAAAVQPDQPNQRRPDAPSVVDEAVPGAVKLHATMNAARPTTTVNNESTQESARHNNEPQQSKLSSTESKDETNKTFEAQSASARSGPKAPIDPTFQPHDSPMAKLLHACQTSVQGPSARPQNRSTADHPGMKDFKSAQPEYTARHGVSVVNHHAVSELMQESHNGFIQDFDHERSQPPVSHSRSANDHPGMEGFEFAQPRYAVQTAVPVASHPPGVEVMQVPYDAYIEDIEHERSYRGRSGGHQSYDAQFLSRHRERRPYRSDQQQQQQQQQQYYHHSRYHDENVERRPQNHHTARPSIQTSYMPRAGGSYEDEYLQDQQAHILNNHQPQHGNMHNEHYHYPYQPVHHEAIYYEDYEDDRPQDIEAYRDYDTEYMMQEQDLYMPQEYGMPPYDLRDAIDMDMEQQIAEEEMMGVEQEGIEAEEHAERSGFVPDSFWRSRKRW